MNVIKPTKFRPTWRWGVCAVVTMAMLFASINYQKNALHWLAYTCGALLLYSTAYSRYITRTWTWAWSVPVFAFASQTWRIETPLSIPGTFHGGDLSESTHSITADSPGLLLLNTGVWSTEYPLGLFRTTFHVPALPPVWIYPQAINHRHRTRAQEPDWTSIRDYQPGDGPRHILKKTQTLPPQHWQVRSNHTTHTNQEHTANILNWEHLPTEWSFDEKLQQLSFDIQNMGTTNIFEVTTPMGSIGKGHGIEHQHRAWRMLSTSAMEIKSSSTI